MIYIENGIQLQRDGGNECAVTLKAIREIVKPEHLRALATWSASAKTDERAGLRMIQAIIKYQGTKRFRTKNIDQDDKDVYLADTIEYTSAPRA